jgi:transposase
MKLATKTTNKVFHLGIDDFSLRRGRTSGTVLVDLQRHHILDLLPDRQKETAATWMKTHPEITHVSRDRKSRVRQRGSCWRSASDSGS